MSKYCIEIKPTAREAVFKFESNRFLAPYKAFTYKTKEEAAESPLASELLAFPLINMVYIAENYIAIEFKDEADTIDFQEKVKSKIEAYLNSGKPLFKEGVNDKPKFLPIEIYTEMTPNPGVLKFVCSRKLVIEPVRYDYTDEPKDSPLAKKLFEFSYVKRVAFENNHILITKGGKVTWEEVSIELREFLRNYLIQLNPVVVE